MTGRGPSRPLWAPFLVLASVIVAADQVTKAWILEAVAPDRPIAVLGDLVRLVYVENTGAIFGLFRDLAGPFAIASIVVLGIIVVFHGRSGRSPYMTLTLGLLLGGAIGNLIDRLRFGFVVDFVDLGIGTSRFYTFNVADAAITGSILLFLLLAIRPSLAGPTPAAPAATEAATTEVATDA